MDKQQKLQRLTESTGCCLVRLVLAVAVFFALQGLVDYLETIGRQVTP